MALPACLVSHHCSTSIPASGQTSVNPNHHPYIPASTFVQSHLIPSYFFSGNLIHLLRLITLHFLMIRYSNLFCSYWPMPIIRLECFEIIVHVYLATLLLHLMWQQLGIEKFPLKLRRNSRTFPPALFILTMLQFSVIVNFWTLVLSLSQSSDLNSFYSHLWIPAKFLVFC